MRSDTLAGGQSGVIARGLEVAGAREIVWKKNWEQEGGLQGPTGRFDGSVQESLNTE